VAAVVSAAAAAVLQMMVNGRGSSYPPVVLESAS